jgi:hypothetical protein
MHEDTLATQVVIYTVNSAVCFLFSFQEQKQFVFLSCARTDFHLPWQEGNTTESSESQIFPPPYQHGGTEHFRAAAELYSGGVHFESRPSYQLTIQILVFS